MKNTLLLFLIFLSTILHAQQWTNCTSGHYVIDLVRYNETMWVATTGGLVKHNLSDGSSQLFNRGNSPIPSNYILSMAIDSEGQLWLSTRKGTIIFNGTTWENFSDKWGYLHLDQDNKMMIAGSYSLDTWNGQSFESIELPFASHDYLFTSAVEINPANGDIWLSYSTYLKYVVYKYSNGVFTAFDYENSPLPFESPVENPLLLDNENRLWAGNHAGLFRYENGVWDSIQTIIPGFPSGEVSALEIDSEGNIWAAVTSEWINPEGQLVKIISDDEFEFHALPGSFGDVRKIETLEIIESPELTVYAGSSYFGLWAYDLDSWRKIPTDQSAAPSNSLRQIFVDGSNVYMNMYTYHPYRKHNLFSINQGVWEFYDETSLPFTLNDPYGPTFLTRGPNDNLWVHSGDSLFSLKNDVWTLAEVPDLLPGVEEVNSFIHFEPNGNRWLLERYQSYIFYESDEGWKSFHYDEHGARSGSYDAYFNHPETGDFWLASANGISRYDGQNWSFIDPEDYGMQTSWVTAMVVTEQGVIYATTYDGILRIENNEPEIFIKDIPGLEGRSFGTIIQDSENRLWVGLDNAIAFFDGGSWQVFDNSNSGVTVGRINQMAFDNDQNLWFGSASGGIGIYHPDGLADYYLDDFHAGPAEPFVQEAQPDLTIFPNPVSRDNSLSLEIPIDFPINNSTHYAIYNSVGQQIFKRKLLTYRLNIPLYPIQAAGTYFLHIKNNSESITAKVLIY